MCFSIIIEYQEANFDSQCDDTRKRFVAYEFAGIVETKYLDENNHLLPTLSINNSEFRLEWKYRDIFNLINEGDSLVKSSGCIPIIRYRNGIREEIIFEVNCESYKRPFSWRNVFSIFHLFFGERDD